MDIYEADVLYFKIKMSILILVYEYNDIHTCLTRTKLHFQGTIHSSWCSKQITQSAYHLFTIVNKSWHCKCLACAAHWYRYWCCQKLLQLWTPPRPETLSLCLAFRDFRRRRDKNERFSHVLFRSLNLCVQGDISHKSKNALTSIVTPKAGMLRPVVQIHE